MKSAIDRALPTPQRTLWAQSPQPDSFAGSYGDATGAYSNYVYNVEAADENGAIAHVTIVSFGAKASGEGWLEIDAKGSSGVHYHELEEADVPQAAREAIARAGRD